MNLSDTFYVALCMTILILGVVYWFWTQNQFIQRKLNLLENVVYEMRSSLGPTGVAPDGVDAALANAEKAIRSHAIPAAPTHSEPVDFSDLDLDDDDNLFGGNAPQDVSGVAPSMEIAPCEAPAPHSYNGSGEDSDIRPFDEGAPIGADDLAPGGLAGVEFDVSDTSNETVLNSMGLKELKELAEQKKIPNAKKMRKHELVSAIRASKTVVTPFEIKEGTIELN
jgi:hypothetical protein